MLVRRRAVRRRRERLLRQGTERGKVGKGKLDWPGGVLLTELGGLTQWKNSTTDHPLHLTVV